jgi:F-type H+-transporting ATPase subunit delta
VSIARLYADALMGAVGNPDEAARVAGELEAAVALLGREADLRGFFEHPGVAVDAKRQVVREAFASRVSHVTLNFLQLLVDKRRFGVLPEITAAFRDRVAALRGEVEAVVQASRPLGDGEMASLARALGRQSGGRTVRVRAELRPDLLGGVRVVLGDRVLDGSVRGNLVRLRSTLMGSN